MKSLVSQVGLIGKKGLTDQPFFELHVEHNVLTIKAAPESSHCRSTVGLCKAMMRMYVHIPKYTKLRTLITIIDLVGMKGNTKHVRGLTMFDRVSVR